MTRRTVIVTGANSGIGRAAARLFLADDDRVYGVDLGGEPLRGVTAVTADVSRPGDLDQVVASAIAETGRVDVMVSNAGIGSTTSPLDCTPDEWDRVFAVNARGVFLGTKAVLPAMLAQGGGAIVNTASAAGLIGLVDRAAYCASKGAVIAFTKQVAVQYAKDGIRSNCVCPGTVDSPWVGRLLDETDDPEERRRQLIARQPLGRLGTPEEVAQAIHYLASDAAAFITGTALTIDGGITAA